MKWTVTPLRVCVSVPAALIRPHYVSLHSGVLRCVSTYLQRGTFNSGSMGNPRSLMNNNNTHHCIGGKGHCPSASIPQISVTMRPVLPVSSPPVQLSNLYRHDHIHFHLNMYFFFFFSFFLSGLFFLFICIVRKKRNEKYKQILCQKSSH